MTFLKTWSLRARLTFFNFFILIPTLLIVQFYVLPHIEEKLMYDRKLVVQAAVDIADGVVRPYFELAASGQLSVDAAKVAAREALRTLRYQKDEYFFVLDMDHVMILHPIKPALEGKNQYDVTDPSGKYLFREMVETVRKGSGFVHYLWPKPGEEAPQPKVSYVKKSTDWGWVIGNGVYTDDIAKDTRSLAVTTWAGIAIASIASFIIAFLNTRAVSNLLQDTATSLSHLGENLALASTDIERNSEMLSASTTESAVAIEETTASTEQVMNTVKENAMSAKQASDLANRSHAVAVGGKQQVGSLIVATEKIQKESKKIEEIVAVIDDIALQTNLLSLNAAVEAARAGESGRGFAVVAESVRNLAQRSAVSAKDISQLIQESSRNVNEGVRLAIESGKALDEIVESVAKVKSLNEEISKASDSQAVTLSEINKTIGELDSASQRNAVSSEGTLEIAKKLSDEAIQLKSAVNELLAVVQGSSKQN